MRNPTLITHTPDDVSGVRVRFIATLRGDAQDGWRVRDLGTLTVVADGLTRAEALTLASALREQTR